MGSMPGCDAPLLAGVNWNDSGVRAGHYICRTCQKAWNARRVTINGKRVRLDAGGAHEVRLAPAPKRAPESAAEADHMLLQALHRAERKDEREAYLDDLPETARARSGYVYVVTNPAWPGRVKIGRTGDYERRLAGYQTACPDRDYEMPFKLFTKDCIVLETSAHSLLAAGICHPKGEWFRADVDTAVAAIRSMFAKVEAP
jgi:hypothetical protein